MARDIAVKDTRVIRAPQRALNLIDVQRVNSSYRMEQGFTELNLSACPMNTATRSPGRQIQTHDERQADNPGKAVAGVANREDDDRNRGLGSRRKPMAFVPRIVTHRRHGPDGRDLRQPRLGAALRGRQR